MIPTGIWLQAKCLWYTFSEKKTVQLLYFVNVMDVLQKALEAHETFLLFSLLLILIGINGIHTGLLKEGRCEFRCIGIGFYTKNTFFTLF